MTIPVCIEQMETRWIAYAVDLPGCYSSSEDREAALAGLPAAIQAYQFWCQENDAPLLGMESAAPLDLREIIAEWVSPSTGEAVNAFFASDAPAMSETEVERAAQLLEWTSCDLLRAIADLPREKMEQRLVGEWSIRGIFYHTTRGDFWYLRTLGLAPDWSQAPKDNLPALLDWTQYYFLAALPGLVGQARIDLYNGELWSPRKLIRRALWHRRDHVQHIGQFRAALGIA